MMHPYNEILFSDLKKKKDRINKTMKRHVLILNTYCQITEISMKGLLALQFQLYLIPKDEKLVR